MTREEAITILYQYSLRDMTYPKEDIEAFELAIKALEQKSETGHWNSIPRYPDIAWYCSECEYFTTMKHNFCPNCGARMSEVSE